MTDKIKVYQKPTCSKCRTTLGLLRDRGVEFEAVNYYETPLGDAELRELIAKLGISPRELMRKDEQKYSDLKIGKREF
jgi:arsenate reductase